MNNNNNYYIKFIFQHVCSLMFSLISINNFLSYKKYQFLNNKKYFVKFPKKKLDITSREKLLVEQIKKYGYAIIPNFYDRGTCNKFINQINKFMSNHPTLIKRDKLNSDNRIFGAEYISPLFKKSLKKMISFTKKIGRVYLRQDISLFMMMANRVIHKKKNIGSGGGWHKDSFSKQFKSILYLNDVNKTNGAFQIIKNSNNDLFMLKLIHKLGKKFPVTRFSNNEINKFVKNKNKQVVNLTGKAGTLILVDTSIIHRGSPLLNGKRFAITNYFYPKNKLKDYKGHFNPKLSKFINI